MIRAFLLYLLLFSILTGCATTKNSVQEFDDATVCRAYNEVKSGGDEDLTFKFVRILAQRGLGPVDCPQILRDDPLEHLSERYDKFVSELIQGLAAVGRANRQESVDTDWDWDEIHDEAHRLVWVCRGVQSGRLAPTNHCLGKLQIDWRWPSK